MTISFTRGNVADGGASSLTTLASTYPSNNAGNLLVVSVGYLDTAGTITASVADTAGNTWSTACPKARNATQQFAIYTFYAWNCNASAGTNTVTLTVSSAATFLRVHLLEYHSSIGAWGSNPLDQASTATGSSTAMATATVTPGQSNELFVAFGANGGPGTVGPGAGFTAREPATSNLSSDASDLIQGAAAAQAFLLTATNTGQWVIQGATFRDAVPRAAVRAPAQPPTPPAPVLPPRLSGAAPPMFGFRVIQSSGPVHLTSLTGPVTVTLPNPTGAGNTLVACIAANSSLSVNPHVTGITLGGAADNWAAVVTLNSATRNCSEIWYDRGCAAGQTSVAATWGGQASGTSELWITVYEVAGILVADKTSTGEITAATFSSGSTAAVTQPVEIFFGTVYAVATTATATGAGTWATGSLTVATRATCNGYQAVPSGGTATFSGTLNASGTNTAVVASFYSAAIPAVIRPPALSPVQPVPPPSRIILGSPAGALAGAATLTGSGTLTASPVLSAAAALSGSGTLAAAPVLTGAAALTGSGTLTAAFYFAGAAALTGSGTLTAAPVLAAAAALSGSGTLTGGPLLTAAATLSGAGTLTAGPVLTATVTLTGSGTLTVGYSIANGPLIIQATAQPAAPRGPPPSQVIGAPVTAIQAGAATLTGSGTLAAAPYFAGAAALSGSGTLAAAPVLSAAATLTGSGTLTAAPVLTAIATLTGSGTLTAAPVQAATATLSGSGTLTAAPALTAAAALSGTGTLTGGPYLAGAAALSGAGTLTATPAFTPTAVLSGSGTLAAAGQVFAIPAVITPVVQPPQPKPPPPSQVITGPTVLAPSATLSGSGTLAATPTLTVTAAATLSGAGTLGAAPALTVAAVLSGTGTLGAAPVRAGAATLTGAGALTATPVRPAVATLTGVGTLTGAPVQVIVRTAVLTGVGTLTGTQLPPPPTGLLIGTSCGPPHTRWAAGEPCTRWDTAGGPHTMRAASEGGSRYGAGEPHGRWSAREPHR